MGSTVKPSAQGVKPGQKPRAWSRLQMIVAAFGASLVVAILCLAAYIIWDSRKEALDRGELTAQTLAHVIEAQTRHAFMSAEQSLINVERMLTLIPQGSPSGAADIHALLHDMAARQPHVRSIFVTDRNGRLIHSSSGAAAANIDASDREYFQAQRNRPDRGLYVGPPVISRVGGARVINVSRRLNGVDGAFGGVVAAAIESDYFQNFYSQVNTGKDGSIVLFLRDGTLLFRGPPVPEAVGKSYTGVEPFSELLPAAPSGVYHAGSAIDNVKRVFAYRAIAGLPLVVMVGMSERELLARWQRDIKTVALPALAVILAIMGLTGFLVRETGRRETLAATLREGEQRYRYLFEANPHPMWIYDTETLAFLAVNDAAASHYGYSREEFLAMTARDIRPAEEIPRIEQLVSTLDPKLNQSGVWRHRKKDGTVFDAEIVSHGFDFNGRPARLVLAQDISARLRAERELRESEERYRSLFEGNPVPVWVMDEETLEFLVVNQAAVRKYGYTREEFLSRTIADMQVAEDRSLVVQQIRSRDARARARYQRRHVTKSGQIVEAEVTAQPFVFNGRQARIILIDDITERKRAEAERAFLAAIVENSTEAIISRTLDGTITSWNAGAERMLGYSAGEAIGRGIDFTLPSALAPGIGRNNESLLHGKAIALHEIRSTTKDGQAVDVLSSVSPIRNDAGEIIGASVILHDITAVKQAEAALRESEGRFRAIFEQAAVGMALRDIDPRNPRWLRVNQKLCDILGYTREELLQLSSVDITPPEDRDAAIDYNEQLVRGEITRYSREKRYVRKSGEIIWTNISLSVMRGPEGAPAFIISVIQDLTDRKRVEAEQRRLAAIVESSQDAIVSRALDGAVLSWNAGAEKIFGYSAAEMIGRSISLLSPPEHHHESRRNTAMLLKGEAVPSFETVRIAKEGRSIHVQISVSPIRDDDGRIYGVSAIFRDITDRKKAEEALARERTLLRAVIDNLPEHIYVKDRERRYLLINKTGVAALDTASREVVAGTTVFDYFPPEQAAQYDAEDRSVIETGKSLIGREQVNIGADGQKQWYLTTKVPLRDPVGNIIGIIGINHDITALQQSAEVIGKLNMELEQRVIERTAQLETANRELESFAYSVSHDLRAPLRSIDGFSQALIEDYHGRLDATGQDYLRRVRTATQRMATLIDDLLALSRITRGEMHRATTDLSALAREIVADIRKEQPKREIDVKVARGMKLQADPRLLRVALDNLLRNAWKYTARQPNAQIEVGVEQKEGRPVYFVRDNGVGFDMRYAGKLFGAFQRLHSDSDFPGTGIGLATVQRVIHRHGGEIWAHAEVGKGATFFFTIGNGMVQ